MAKLIIVATPIWKFIIVASSVLGGILLIGGIALAILGGAAQTTFILFGNQFSSTSIGVSLAFIGAVLIVVTLRRVLVSVDKITTGNADSDGNKTPSADGSSDREA